MYRNLIIEPLGTLVHYDPREYLMKCLMSAKTEDEIYDLTFGSEEWQSVAMGNLSRATANRLILEKSRAIHRQFEVQAVLDDWKSILTSQDAMARTLKKLKGRGFRIYYLTNMSGDVRSMLEQRDFWKLFDGGIASCDFHRGMPDSEILTALLRVNYLMEHETIYVDHSRENVETAFQLGVAGIEFKSAGRLMRALESSDII